MPIWNWNKIHETGDLKYLLIADDYKDIEGQNTEENSDLWMELYQQYIDEFGVHADYERLIKKKQQLTARIAEYIATGDRFKLNKIHITELEIKSMTDDKEPQKFHEVITTLDEFFNRDIDPKVLTVKKYYSYIKRIESKAKAHGQAG